MSKVIQVLAQMSSDATCQSDEAIQDLLITTELGSDITEAISNKNVTSLERQLDVCPDVVCFIAPAEDDDESEEKEDKDSTEETNSRVISF